MHSLSSIHSFLHSYFRAEVPIKEDIGSVPSPEPEEETRVVSQPISIYLYLISTCQCCIALKAYQSGIRTARGLVVEQRYTPLHSRCAFTNLST